MSKVVDHPTRERWLTLKEAADKLHEDYGLVTTWRSLEKLVGAGMPSAKNFGRRQVRMTRILPWLKANGYIEEG